MIVSQSQVKKNISKKVFKTYPPKTATNAYVKFFNWPRAEALDVLERSQLVPFAQNIQHLTIAREGVTKAVKEAVDDLAKKKGRGGKLILQDEEFRKVAGEFCVIPEVAEYEDTEAKSSLGRSKKTRTPRKPRVQ